MQVYRLILMVVLRKFGQVGIVGVSVDPRGEVNKDFIKVIRLWFVNEAMLLNFLEVWCLFLRFQQFSAR